MALVALAGSQSAYAIEAVILHPIFAERYACTEHAAWEKMVSGNN